MKDIPWKYGAKETVVIMLISDEIEFRAKDIIRNEDTHYTIVKAMTCEECVSWVIYLIKFQRFCQ